MLRKPRYRSCTQDIIYTGPGIASEFPGKFLVSSGGPILRQPEIVRLYWGNWRTPIDYDISLMELYLQGLVSYMSGNYPHLVGTPVLNQYGVVGATLGAFYIDNSVPGGALEAADLQNKLIALQTAKNLPVTDGNRIFVVFTNGITWNQSFGAPFVPAVTTGWCALHGYFSGNPNQYVALVPYPLAPGCLSSAYPDAMANWQTAASHEIFEAATDPEPFTGWHWGVGITTSEGGDVCPWAGWELPGVGAVQSFVDGPATRNHNVPCSLWQGEPQAVTPTINGTGTATGTAGTTGDGTVVLDVSYVIGMNCLTPGATIYYTLDGSTPGSASTEVYNGEFGVDVTSLGAVTIKAVATALGARQSAVATLRLSPP